MANRYQRNVEAALRGSYAADLDVKSKLKLRMHLRDLADHFEKEIRMNEHTLPFQKVDGSTDADYLDENVEDIDQDAPNIMQWIREKYRDARGAELPGTVNPTLLINLFRQQTVHWEQIAGSYLDQVVQLITEYVQLESRRTEEDETIRASLESLVLSRIESTEASARSQLLGLLNDKRGAILQTINHYYAETLENIPQDRVIARLQGLGFQGGMTHTINMSSLTNAMHLSNEDQGVTDIYDVLKAFYKVSVKRFEDYVVVSVVERMLGDQEALKFFSSEHVGSLSDLQLAEIAAESYTTSAARVELENRSKRFCEALQVAKSV